MLIPGFLVRKTRVCECVRPGFPSGGRWVLSADKGMGMEGSGKV